MKFEQPQMEACIRDTTALYQSLRNQLLHLPATEHDTVPTGEWTKRQTLGHCCDGTATNIQRLVRSQYEDAPPRIVYTQAEWVRIQSYASYDWSELVEFWFSLNKHILHIYKHMPLSGWSNRIGWGTEERSALWFYHHHFVRHTLSHLEDVLSSPVPAPATIPQFDMAGNPV